MFEHTGSRWFPFNLMLNVMTPITRLNRPGSEPPDCGERGKSAALPFSG